MIPAQTAVEPGARSERQPQPYEAEPGDIRAQPWKGFRVLARGFNPGFSQEARPTNARILSIQ